MIDSHCHLAGSEFTADLAEVVDRATASGVMEALVILAADDAEELRQAPVVAALWPGVRFAVGVHPHQAAKFSVEPEEAADAVEEALDALPLARCVGEIGLDYHYEFSPREVQRAVFRHQLRLAARLGLPISIHTREAADDTFRILEEEGVAHLGVVLHCFTGDARMAARALTAGCHLSFSGIVTFPRALELREVARDTPLDRLLIETDSPYLAPVPHRGKRNEPAHVGQVAQTIAALRGIEPAAVAAAALENYRRLFRP